MPAPQALSALTRDLALQARLLHTGPASADAVLGGSASSSFYDSTIERVSQRAGASVEHTVSADRGARTQFPTPKTSVMPAHSAPDPVQARCTQYAQ